MDAVTLGQAGPEVSRAGLGLMGMSGTYGPADRAESIATIRAALDAGITLLDTGDFYGMGHSELLLAEALRGVRRDSVFIQVKFGAQRDPAGAFVGYDTSPGAVKTALAYSLQRLGTDYVDLYQPARLDPDVPIPAICRIGRLPWILGHVPWILAAPLAGAPAARRSSDPGAVGATLRQSAGIIWRRSSSGSRSAEDLRDTTKRNGVPPAGGRVYDATDHG